MAVSGSTDFNLEAAEVIQEAYERCGLQEISGKDLRAAVRSMNLLMSEWANRGLNLWTVSLGTQSTTASDNDYDFYNWCSQYLDYQHIKNPAIEKLKGAA